MDLYMILNQLLNKNLKNIKNIKMSKITFKLADSELLINYLKRFSSLNKRLLLEIGFDERRVNAKTSNDNRSVVKSSTVSMGDLFDESTLEDLDKPLLIGLHDISIVSSVLSTMSNDVTMEVTYDDYESNYIAESIKFSTPHITINIPCLNYKLFKHITDDIFTTITSIDTNHTEFNFNYSNIEKTIKLLSLDLTINSGITDTAEIASFITSSDGIHLKSDQVNYLIAESFDGSDNPAKFKKDILQHLDKSENQTVSYDTEKVVFISNDSQTTVITGQTE